MMLNPLNKVIMDEIGLTIDNSYRVIDQDTRAPIVVGDKTLKFSSQHFVPVRNNEQIFDPITQRKQMNVLFDYFVGKIEDEGTPVDMYYEVNDGNALEVKSGLDTITTEAYNNDILKYVDMMTRLNGSDPSTIKKYDDKKKPTPSKRRPKKFDFEKV